MGKNANIFRMNPGSKTGLKFVYSKGNGYRFSCSVSSTKRWDIFGFGKTINQAKWNQFTFTIDDSTMACAYINGVKEMCQTVPTSVSNIVSTGSLVRIGGAWYRYSEPMMYFDDFGIWQVVLTPDDVMNLYILSND